jgi:hypothetical protein
MSGEYVTRFSRLARCFPAKNVVHSLSALAGVFPMRLSMLYMNKKSMAGTSAGGFPARLRRYLVVNRPCLRYQPAVLAARMDCAGRLAPAEARAEARAW